MADDRFLRCSPYDIYRCASFFLSSINYLSAELRGIDDYPTFTGLINGVHCIIEPGI